MAPIALCILTLLLAAPAAHAVSWQRPLDGPLLRAFAVGGDRYARGQHRGADLAAPPGSPVRSACGGRVAFAGRVPRGGLTVSVRCGALIATYQQLGAIAVRAHRAIAPGTRLGTVGRSADPRTPRAHLHLGAREAATGRYVDPLSLLGGGSRPVIPALPPRAVPRGLPPGRAPAPLPPRVVPLGRAPAPVLPRAVVLGHAPAPAFAAPPGPASTLPWPVWTGLASIALALPTGGLFALRRRRRLAPRRALATAR